MMPSEQDWGHQAKWVPDANVTIHFIHFINCRSGNWCPCIRELLLDTCLSTIQQLHKWQEKTCMHNTTSWFFNTN
jgi:hypothetical protein